MFSNFNTIPRGVEVLNRIAQQLTHTVANFGLIVMREGEYGDELFFIESGEVDVYRKLRPATEPASLTTTTTSTTSSTDGLVNLGGKTTVPALSLQTAAHSDFRNQIGVRLGRLGVNAFFGELGTFSRGNGQKRGVRTRTVVSRSACHFHVLRKRSLDALRAEIPVLDRQMTIVEDGLFTSVDYRVLPAVASKEAEAIGVGDAGRLQPDGGAMEKRLQQQMKALEAKTEAQAQRLEAKLDQVTKAVEALLTLQGGGEAKVGAAELAI